MLFKLSKNVDIVDNNNQISLDASKERIEKGMDGNIAIVSHLSFCVVPK
jgi:hypothetical protein